MAGSLWSRMSYNGVGLPVTPMDDPKYFKTGQAITMPAGTPHNRLLLSICHAMGLTDVTAFGNPKFCTAGPIKEMLV